jgi:precorrin-6Y C5,15-methyltransferase (decarboxylating)
LTIIGIGEDGVAGLAPASQAALDAAEVIMGPARHIDLVPDGAARRIVWPVPFADGLETLLSLRGQKVVVLASGDPFWFGAGTTIARSFAEHGLDATEWTALPGPSCFSLAAARLGWALDQTTCLGLHAAPFQRLLPHLAPGQRLITTVRDGESVAALGAYVTDQGFGDSELTIMERLGGPHERLSQAKAASALDGPFAHPVVVAIAVAGQKAGLPATNGLSDAMFDSDGQMTKRPIRAITLSSLAPRPGELLWDIGGGSGSVSVEWCLAHPGNRAVTIEPRADRVQHIAANAARFGLTQRLKIVEGAAPRALEGLATPTAIFVGGGLTAEVLEAIVWRPVRLVVNAVTLEGEALLSRYQATHGGDLMRIGISRSTPIGNKHGWASAFPVVQWSRVP